MHPLTSLAPLDRIAGVDWLTAPRAPTLSPSRYYWGAPILVARLLLRVQPGRRARFRRAPWTAKGSDIKKRPTPRAEESAHRRVTSFLWSDFRRTVHV